jgi:hypothetical protein
VPQGLVLRGLCEERNGIYTVRVVPRASLPAELEQFEHARMPVMEEPLFSAESITFTGDIEPTSFLPGFEV